MALLSTLQDPFTGTSLNGALWQTFESSGSVTYEYTSSGAKIDLPSSSPASTYGEIYSQSTYDMTGSYAYINVKNVYQSSTHANAVLHIVDSSSGNRIKWFVEAGTLYAAKYLPSSGQTNYWSTAYSSTTHAWWRIRESGGTTFWDTSTNGTSWTNRFSIANPITVTAVSAIMDGTTYEVESNPGSFKFSNFNIPPTGVSASPSMSPSASQSPSSSLSPSASKSPSASVSPSPAPSYPLFETLSDNFNDGQRDPTLWNSTGTYVVEQFGQLLCGNSSVTAPSYSGYYTKNLYDLTASYVYSQLIDAGDQTIASWQAIPIQLYLNATNYIQWYIEDSTLHASKTVAGVASDVLATTAYDPAIHKYFKIREASGTVYWDYSADSINWVNYTSLANPFAVTGLLLYIQSGIYATETRLSTAIFDNVNVAQAPDRSSDNPRVVTQSLQVSWKKDFASGIAAFTIGSSSIGGTDFIGSPNQPVISAWNKYRYIDESGYVMGLSVDRQLQMPTGGLSIARADVKLNNTSGRFLPEYMRGTSELFTSILPRRPIIINAGFNYDGVDHNQPRMVGVLDKTPMVDLRNRTTDLSALDFLSYLQDKRADNTSMYTGQRFDQILDDIFHNKLGLATAQYELDVGAQNIPFAVLEAGTKVGDFINQITQAELGNVLQDESGKIHYWNRFRWNTSPYNFPQQTLFTSDVLEAYAPDEDHIINVVEVNSTPLQKSGTTTLYSLATPIQLATGTNEVWLDFDNPVILVTSDSFTANSQDSGGGTNDTASVILDSTSVFTKTAKYVFKNNTGRTSFITALTVSGRWATVVDNIYRRYQDDSSVTAYEERVLSVDNDYIQTEGYAQSYAQYVLNQLSEPEGIIKLVIRAKPQLKLGDLISWQGLYWRIIQITDKLDPSGGYNMELTLIKRQTLNYFTVGVSTIGSVSSIAP